MVGDEEEIRRVASGYDRQLVHDSRNRPLILFESPGTLQKTMERETDLEYHSVAP